MLSVFLSAALPLLPVAAMTHDPAPPPAAMPSENAVHSDSVRLGEILELGDGLSIEPVAIVEDSCCPAGVMCIQAGKLVIAATITAGGDRFTSQLALGERLPFGDGILAFVSATPAAPPVGGMSRASNYEFGFSYWPSPSEPPSET